MIKKFITCFFLFSNYFVFSQSHTMSGFIKDSLQEPLTFANVLAKPLSEKTDLAFAISDEKGRYKLVLEENQPYSITISFLGFTGVTFEANLTKDIIKNIVLKPSDNELDEVIVVSNNPVTIREDTITYKTDVFTTGEERKLREVLNKLPGVEVDRQGGVLVNGKKVTQLLVDGKIFFGGGTKLGVENIPADAVANIEVIDNYNEVAFLKGLNESEKMALNIKLKEGKKKFIFGDVEAGGGFEERYLIHPNLFYYSPKTNLNFIGDLNNIGTKSFTAYDYINFEGGIGKMFKDPSSYFNLQNDDFYSFLENDNFKTSKNNFAAGQISHNFNQKLNLSVYSIYSDTETETETQSINTYNSEANLSREIRSLNGDLDNHFFISKVSLDYVPNSEEDISYSGFLKTSDNNRLDKINTVSSTLVDSILNKLNTDALTIKQNVEWHKKLSSKHTFSSTVNYFYNKTDPTKQWLSQKPFLPELLPLIDEDFYSINQIKELETQNLDVLFKHYWVLNNTNHIYTTIGNNFLTEKFKSTDFQELKNGDINDFEDSGFGNDLDFTLNDLFVGFQHKFKVGIASFTYGASIHHYTWNVVQDSEINRVKTLILPDFLSKIKISSSQKINLKYNLKSNFTNVENYANRMQILSYNSVKIGNGNLENQLYHSARLWYSNFSMFRSLILNASINFNKKINGIREEVLLNGINQLRHPVLLDNPETNWVFSGGLRKGIKNFTFKFDGKSQFSEYEQRINLESFKNKSNSHNLKFTFSSNFKKWPNFDIGYAKRFSELVTPNSISKYTFDEPFIKVNYNFLNNFFIKADYNSTIFSDDNGNRNSYEIANAQLEYHKEDSMWSFKVSGSNILGVTYKNDTYISDFITSENRIYIMPRIWMFSIVYKL